MRLRKYISLYPSLSASVLALLISGIAAAQVTQTRPPNPNITAPGRHAQQPAGGQHPPNNAGDVEGFVYWDANTITHKPAGTCSGLAVNVTAAGSSNNVLQIGNNFKYAGQVKAFLYGGKQAVYDVCIYAYDKLPVGPQLQAQLVITQPGAFSPIVAAQTPTISPITIINAQCNMLPAIVPSTVGDLTSHWGSCQNRAFDVNFALVPSAHLMGSSAGSGGTLLSSSKGAINPGAVNSDSRGMLMGGTNPGPPQSSSSGMLVPAVKPAQTQAPSGTTAMRAKLLPAKPGAATLTNADIIRLTQAGIPESAIVNQIASSNKQFDFSPKSCSALKRQHVSPEVLDAMGDGSVRPCFTGGVRTGTGNGADDLNPQPYPPKGTGVAPGGSANAVQLNTQQQAALKKSSRGSVDSVKPIKLALPKALHKLTNPRLSQQNESIIAVLEQQRVAAQQDSAAMKSSPRSAATGRTTAVAANVQGSMPASGLSPAQTQSAPGNLISSIERLQPFNSVVLGCSMDSTPRILRVNGGQTPGIFTPEAKYNQYTIVGCSFGQQQGTAHIFAAGGFSANLNIDYWSNTGITAHLDPSLAGVLDQNNVTLVVAPPEQQQIQKSGYKFYAARGMPNMDGSHQEVQLAYNSMSQGSVTLSGVVGVGKDPNVADANTLHNVLSPGFDQLSANFKSDSGFSFQGSPVAGWVFRYAYAHTDEENSLLYPENWFTWGDHPISCYINDVSYQDGSNKRACAAYFARLLSFSSDTWDFSNLRPGFFISSYDLYYSDPDPKSLCTAWDEASHADGLVGNWDFNLSSSNQITVNWPVYWCTDTEAIPFSRVNQQEQSAYGVAVWVLGPRCIDPWTGQKDQSCMVKVKQILG
jgi:hypothetical protein